MKNIFLIGMPSSGKSTLGHKLADALHYGFVDTDRLVVRAEKRSIAEIFAEEGEAYFREAESRALRSVKPGRSKVVATGGGLPAFHDNMAYIRQTGVSVFLDVPLATLLERMRASVDENATTPAGRLPVRPLFDPADPALAATLQERYVIRRPFYEQADIHIRGEADENEILRQLGEWL